jgi:ADP-ribosyl-[dinitrogen reductase] hydrolase
MPMRPIRATVATAQSCGSPPIPLAYAHDPEQAIRLAGEMSRTTHGAPEPVDACRYSAALIIGALRGETKQTLREPLYGPIEGL